MGKHRTPRAVNCVARCLDPSQLPDSGVNRPALNKRRPHLLLAICLLAIDFLCILYLIPEAYPYSDAKIYSIVSSRVFVGFPGTAVSASMGQLRLALVPGDDL